MIMIIDFVAFSMHHTAPTKLVWVGACQGWTWNGTGACIATVGV